MSSSNPARLAPEERRLLLELARSSIRRGLCGETLELRGEDYPEALRAPRASFVTLHVDAMLRGCIGTLEARASLVTDVAHNAQAAAFRDPRFPALTWPEFERLDIHLSILSVPEPLTFESEEHLLRQLRPGVDGLILEEGRRRGTFLPSVWESLPEPEEFLGQLKRKAGLATDYWSSAIRVSRYIAEIIP